MITCCTLCREEIDPRRIALGYGTCIDCGSPRKTFPVAQAYNKGGLQLLTEGDLRQMRSGLTTRERSVLKEEG